MSKLLLAWSDGDRSALDKLTPIVYDELHRLARRHMKRDDAMNALAKLRLVSRGPPRYGFRESTFPRWPAG